MPHPKRRWALLHGTEPAPKPFAPRQASNGAMLARLLLFLLLPQVLHAQTVVCFGDSLTAGFGAPAGASYPDALRRMLAAGGSHAAIANQGVSGDTTKDGLARIGAVLRLHPDIVVVELGANDGLRGFPVPEIERNLDAILARLQAAHVQVLLLGMRLPPNLGPDYVGPYEAIFPALAAKYKVSFVPFLLDHVWDHQELLSPDNLHPNGDGYQVVANNVLAGLKPMLAKEAGRR